MKTSRQQSDHIIHDLKNLLSVLVLAVDNLMQDKNHAASQQPNLLKLAGLVQELIVRVDNLAQVVGTDSDLKSKCSASDQRKIIPIKGKFQGVRYLRPSGRLSRSANAAADRSQTHPRSSPENRGHNNFS